MKTSKFVRIDPNVLLEYTYDDGNLISEPYSIIYNTNTQVYSFLSSLPETKNYIADKTILVNGQSQTVLYTNQLVKLDGVQGQYGLLSLNTYSFIQKRDYGISIPLRYDKIRVWIPTNYVFGDMKGFSLRVFTLDFNNQKFIDLSNYFFNISDPNQSDEMEYSNPPLVEYQVPWGKYIEIQFPSPDKVSDQRRNNITRDNTINYNLSEGVGLSKDAPVFVEFQFITGVQKVNNNTYYNLAQKRSVSFPQTPEFQKFGVVIEQSTQGDFFLIYPIYNGSIGEFNQFIEESTVFGNRYYLDYQIDVYEKNILSYTQRVLITENFIEEIEFRPIFKYTSTTAIIDVTCKLIDAVDESEIVRKASYALLQDEVSNYSKYVSKIDLVKADKVDVFKVKGISTPNLDINNSNTIKTSLTINKQPFVVYSRNYDVVKDTINASYLEKDWIANRQLTIPLFPFDDVIRFNLIFPDQEKQYLPYDISGYDEVKMVIKSDKKTLPIEQYKDSDQNDLEGGKVVFRIIQDKYGDIKKVFTSGFNTFYLTGSLNGMEDILYTGFFQPWDTPGNITNLSNNFDLNKNNPSIKKSTNVSQSELKKIDSIKNLMADSLNKQTSTNTSEISSVKAQNLNLNPNDPLATLSNLEKSILDSWNPYWKTEKDSGKASYNFMTIAYDYQFNKNVTNAVNKYVLPVDVRGFAIKLKDKSLISKLDVNKTTGQLSPSSQAEVDLILGYMKMYGFNPSDPSILETISLNQDDLKDYLKSQKAKPQSIIKEGSNIPPTKDVETKIQDYLSTLLQFEVKPSFINLTKNMVLPFKKI